MSKKNFMSPDNYGEVVKKLTDAIGKMNADTILGNQLKEYTYHQMRDGITPLHAVREFILRGKEITNDASLNETSNYCAKVLKHNNSLNFNMGLAIEEHLDGLMKLGIPDPLQSVEDLRYEFNQPDVLLKQSILAGKFDKLNSTIYEQIKEHIGHVQTVDGSYNSIVSRIIDKFNEQTGTNPLVSETYSKLLESNTPIFELKEFLTKAEKISGDDVKLKEIVDFCKKQTYGNDLNFLINICKEEHFSNLKRAGHPNPEQTIADIEHYFKHPANHVIDYIKQGIFDRLESKLLNDVKGQMGIEVIDRTPQAKALNEALQRTSSNIIQYNPVGFAVPNGQEQVFVMEQDVLRYDTVKEEFDVVDEFEPTMAQQQLIDAIQNVQYDPLEELFSLSDNWDFCLQLDTKTGKMMCGKDKNNLAEINKENVNKLLLESIVHYQKQNPLNFNRNAFVQEADRFKILMENQSKLVKFDNLRVIKNLNEGSNFGRNYILFDINQVKVNEKPRILSNGGTLFESFNSMISTVENQYNIPLQNLFEDEIQNEFEIQQHNQMMIDNLIQDQKELNESISKCNKLLAISEPGSPAYEKLQSELKTLNEALIDNIKDLEMLMD